MEEQDLCNRRSCKHRNSGDLLHSADIVLRRSRDVSSMKRLLRWVAIALAAGIALSLGVYLYASHSEPYRFSEQWVRQSADVRAKVGEVQETRLSPSLFADELKGDVREARVSVLVRGANGSLIARLRLQKSSGTNWVVKRCQLDMQE